MIITKILGGLGNQLFQYAAGKTPALQNNTELKLDLTGFDKYKLRNFELAQFDVSFAVASEEEIKKYKASTTLQRLWSRLSPATQKCFYKQPFFHFDKEFFSLRSPVYIQGYFQSEKYFEPVMDNICNELRFKEALSPNVIAVAAEMKLENSISIHMRRGDYKNEKNITVHEVLPESYYQKGVEYLKQNIGEEQRLYIFSDDAKAAENLHLYNAQIISGRITQNHYEDFYLMQHCRHNIIANSSFSWWAAWLNKNPEKIVVAPKQWFGKTGPKDTQDLLPESWIRL